MEKARPLVPSLPLGNPSNAFREEQFADLKILGVVCRVCSRSLSSVAIVADCVGVEFLNLQGSQARLEETDDFLMI